MSFALALILAQAASMQSADCITNAATQQDMNACAAQDFTRADDALNAQWAITAADMRQRDADTAEYRDDRPSYFDQLLAAQRAWLSFRDAHCASEGYAARGGSMEPMLVALCRTTLTRERTQQLLDLTQP